MVYDETGTMEERKLHLISLGYDYTVLSILATDEMDPLDNLTIEYVLKNMRDKVDNEDYVPKVQVVGNSLVWSNNAQYVHEPQANQICIKIRQSAV